MELLINLEAGSSALRLAEELDEFTLVVQAGAVLDPEHALVHLLDHHHLGQLMESGDVALNSDALSFLAAGTVGPDWEDRWQQAVRRASKIARVSPDGQVLARVEWS